MSHFQETPYKSTTRVGQTLLNTVHFLVREQALPQQYTITYGPYPGYCWVRLEGNLQIRDSSSGIFYITTSSNANNCKEVEISPELSDSFLNGLKNILDHHLSILLPIQKQVLDRKKEEKENEISNVFQAIEAIGKRLKK